MEAPAGLKEAQDLAAKFHTERYIKLDRLERYVHGSQYEHRADFMAPQEDVPLFERAPCIVAPVVQTAITQHIDFALGEGRFPKLTTGIAEDDSELDDEFGLDEEQSKVFDAFLCKLIESSRFQDACQSVMADAEGISTAVGVICVRRGRIAIETVPAKCCTPTFTGDGYELESLEIKYPYIDRFKGGDGKLHARTLIYRRVIGVQSDTVFKPAVAPPNGVEPTYQEDPEKSVKHGFGFCPVVWYPFRRGHSKANHIDGYAIHERLTDEIDALNFSLSQRYRAAMYSGDPQMVEIGVDKLESPAPTGMVARVVPRYQKDGADVPGDMSGWNFLARPRDARRKGAGTVWRYTSKDAKVELLSLPGDALDGISKHIADVEEKLAAAMGYTRIDLEQVRGAISGKALAFLFSRTTAFVDRVRQDMWDGFMLPAIVMMLRICLAVSRSKQSLFVAGLKKVAPILAMFEREVDGAGMQFFPPTIRAEWGKYFDSTSDDELAQVKVAAAARKAGLVTLELAVSKLRDVFHFESADQLAEAIREESAANTPPALANAAEPQESDKPADADAANEKAETPDEALPAL